MLILYAVAIIIYPFMPHLCTISDCFCRFSRLINTGDTDNDLNLGTPLFQLYGTSSVRGTFNIK